MAEAINLARGTGARPRALATLFVAIVAVAAYARTLTFGYVWDDHDLVARNPLARALDPGRRISSAGASRASGAATIDRSRSRAFA